MNICYLILIIQSLIYLSYCWNVIDYQNVSTINANTIDCITFSQTYGVYYMSISNSSGLKVIKYQKGINSPDVEIMSYTPTNQVYPKDRIQELVSVTGQQYLIVSSTQDTFIQVYNSSSGSLVFQFNNPDPVNTFIYSKTRNSMIMLTMGGLVYLASLNQVGSFITTQYFWNFYNPLEGKLSPDQKYLAVAAHVSGQLIIFDIDQNVDIYDYYFGNADPTPFSWDDTGAFLFYYDLSTRTIRKVNIADFTEVQSPILMNASSSYVYQEFIYTPEMNSILLMVRDASIAGQMKIFNYDPQNLGFTQLNTMNYSYNFKDVVVSKVSPINTIELYVWASPEPVCQFSEIYITGSPPILNTTNATNTTNITIIPTILNTTTVTSSDIRQVSSVLSYTQLMDNTLKSQLISAVNKVPGSRKLLKPLMLFFANFDDLWLYYYHQRNYDYVLTSTFSAVQTLQNQKWQLLSIQSIQSSIGLQTQSLKDLITSIKLPFTSQKYLSIQGSSNGYILQSLNFYTTNFVLLIFTYITGKILYKILHTHKISLKVIFQQFDYWMYFPIICLQGNVQYLSYTFGFQMQSLVKNSFLINFLNSLVIYINFIFFVLIVSMFYIIRYIYLSKAKNLLQNCHHTKYGMLYLTFQFGIRNFLLGLVHIMNQIQEDTRILCLLFIQTVFLTFNIIYVRYGSNECFIKKSKQWINMWTALIRICLISTFLIQEDVEILSQQQIYGQSMFSQIYAVIMTVYMYLWFLSSGIQIGFIMFELKAIFSSNKIQIKKKKYLKSYRSYKNKLNAYEVKRSDSQDSKESWESKYVDQINQQKQIQKKFNKFISTKIQIKKIQSIKTPIRQQKIKLRFLRSHKQTKQIYSNMQQPQDIEINFT